MKKILLPLALCAPLTLLQGCASNPFPFQQGDTLSTAAATSAPVKAIDWELIHSQNAEAKQVGIPEELLGEAADYRIGPGDALFITVWDHPELTNPGGHQQTSAANARIVGKDGTLFFPFVGKIRAEGLTVEELRSNLTGRLGRFINEPQLDVNVVEYHSQRVSVTGAVANPGYITIPGRALSLIEAVQIARIDQSTADPSRMTLTRQGTDYPIDYSHLSSDQNLFAGLYLQSGDRVHLPSSANNKVYVTGRSVQPLALSLSEPNTTLADVLMQAAALTSERYTGRDLLVVRKAEAGEDQTTVYRLEGSAIASMVLADAFIVRPSDVIVIDPRKGDEAAAVASLGLSN